MSAIKTCVLAGVLVLAGANQSRAAKPVDRIVALVNEDAILLSDLAKARKDVAQENALAGKAESVTDADLLQRLIDDRLSLQEAKKLNIEVSEKEIDGAIDDVLRQYQIDTDALKTRLLEQGLTYAEYRQKISEQIRRLKLTNRTVRSRVVVDQSKMQAYYSEHRDSFKDSPKVHLWQFVFRGDDAVSAANELYKLKKLDAPVAATTATKKGAQAVDLGTLSSELLSPEYGAMVSQLENTELSPPFQGPAGTQVLYLQERLPERLKTFDEVKTEIEDRLGREETEKQFTKWLRELRDKSLIQIKL